MTRQEFLKLLAGSLGVTTSLGAAPRTNDGPATKDGLGTAAEGPGTQYSTGVTAALVDFITRSTFESVPDKAVVEAKRCLIDGFGVVLAGATVHGSGIVREYVKASSAASESTILGPSRLSTTAAYAALANGASGHAMDFDDTQLSSTPDRIFGLLTHPTVPVLAASLALAERLGASGRAFLDAFLVGFEVECKIAEAIKPDHYKRGFHSTGTIGTFGAVASAARLLRLDRTATAHAVGIAASMSSGIRVSFGSMTKPLHAGRAAENGVTAAELAARGFTAGDDALDGEWGFFQVLGGGADVARIAHALGKPYSIVDPGVSFKPYPCGSLGHPTMDAMLKLVTDNDVKPDQVAKVRVRAGSNILNPLRYKTAKTELEAKFCLPFMMTSILLRRRAGIREFTDEFVSSAPVQAMMPRVETVFDPAIEARGFDKMRSIVEVDLAGGRRITQAADERYRGSPEKPFTRADLHAKFTDCASLVLPPPRIARALELIESVEQVKDIRELVKALA
jgi:2-methylcitrate dehydratase PrpD